MAAYRRVYDPLTCRLTAKNRDQFPSPTLGDRVWATFTFYPYGKVTYTRKVYYVSAFPKNKRTRNVLKKFFTSSCRVRRVCTFVCPLAYLKNTRQIVTVFSFHVDCG